MIDGSRLLEILKDLATADGTREGAHYLSFELEHKGPVSVASERRRIRELLGTDAVLVEEIHSELPRFLVLRFAGIRRSLSSIGEFSVASELVDRLGLRAAIPEGGRSFPLDHAGPGRAGPEGRLGGAFLDLTCWSKVDPTLANDWVAKYLGLNEIWNSNQGDGITVAQPDTGIAPHAEIDGALDIARSFDALSGNSGEASDPLSSDAGNPGHGTATSSVIASGHDGLILGVAPGASLVPIRCIDSVVLRIDGSSVARAILHASSIGADVISMSLGGPFLYRSVQRAIEIAVENGAIVVSAAGNCVGIVVYPASDQHTIAVAGVGAGDRAWKGTSRGPEVDVSAPAENVFAARRTANDGGAEAVEPSQGTSYATALTAGVAALWLAHHGRDAIRARAAVVGVNVNELFRRAIQLTSRKPKGDIQRSGMGAGILDAGRLLNLSLEEIGVSVRPVDSGTAWPEDALGAEAALGYHAVNELALEGSDRDGFDWGRYGPEALFLARESLARSDPARSGLVESSAKPSMSEGLRRSTKPTVLTRVLNRLDRVPQATVTGMYPASRTDDMFAGLSPVRQGGLETTDGAASRRADIESRLQRWTRSGGLELLERIDRKIIERLNVDDSVNSGVRLQAVESGIEAIQEIQDGRDPGSLPIDRRVGLESLVRLSGRPAFRLREGTVSVEDPMFGDGGWGQLFANWDRLPQITAAVGRVNRGAFQVGTCFLFGVSPNLIMTNRHVLEAIAEEVRTSRGSHWIFADDEPGIDFSESGLDGTRFPVRRVVFAADQAIEGKVDLAALDLVVLEIEGDTSALPPPLELSRDSGRVREGAELFTVGYPARPGPGAFVDPNGDVPGAEIAARLGQIFGISYGRKYLSPGEIVRGTGAMGGDLREWVFSHDATTLGGSSGSMIIALGGNADVVGIHFAGQVMTHNFAHQIAKTGVVDAIR